MGEWGYLYVGHVGMEVESRVGFVSKAEVVKNSLF